MDSFVLGARFSMPRSTEQNANQTVGTAFNFHRRAAIQRKEHLPPKVNQRLIHDALHEEDCDIAAEALGTVGDQ